MTVWEGLRLILILVLIVLWAKSSYELRMARVCIVSMKWYMEDHGLKVPEPEILAECVNKRFAMEETQNDSDNQETGRRGDRADWPRC